MNRAVVVGGGTMGAGIVAALVAACYCVELVEVDATRADVSLNRVRAALDYGRR